MPFNAVHEITEIFEVVREFFICAVLKIGFSKSQERKSLHWLLQFYPSWKTLPREKCFPFRHKTRTALHGTLPPSSWTSTMFQIENDTFDHRVIFSRTFLLSWYWVYFNNSGRPIALLKYPVTFTQQRSTVIGWFLVKCPWSYPNVSLPGNNGAVVVHPPTTRDQCMTKWKVAWSSARTCSRQLYWRLWIEKLCRLC